MKAPFLDCILDTIEDEEEEDAEVSGFMIGGFHTTGNFLTWYWRDWNDNP